ncbi:MAG: nicotinate (nicotinamide) nucleotide adenylyltransferase [Planctomycetes bacterium]|nr:nicotinate (nicotinamide) nucleotide adenylyltransferase [Planctomycetota bacterium]
MARQIVLMGGTFDPVHCGHLIVARAAAEKCGFDRITLLPAGSPPHKHSPLADGSHRLAMLRLAVTGDALFEISDLELSRTGPSYTFDTVAGFKTAGRQTAVAILVGMDMLELLPAWHRAAELLKIADFIIAVRRPWLDRMRRIQSKLNEAFGPRQARKLTGRIIETPLIDISSTDIRSRVRQGLPIRYLVPQAVEEYVLSKGLYRSGE